MKSSTTPLLLRLRARLQDSATLEPERQTSEAIAPLIGSSVYAAIADDSLKDEDSVGWIMQLAPDQQPEWIQCIRWIRLVDRLAESGLGASNSPFQEFVSDWQTLQQYGTYSQDSPHTAILAGLRDRWFDLDGHQREPEVVAAWNQYVLATAAYNHPSLRIKTCEEYEQLLSRLAGSFFQVLPFLAPHQRFAASQFGMVDQMYNHLRDLQEDINHGICYLPLDLLKEFGVSPAEIVQNQALQNPNYYRMMQFWLDVYLPKVRRRVRHLTTAKDLHPSWEILFAWSIHRYRRIEQVLRECEFDYTLFPQIYWQRVKAELPLMLNEVQQHQPGSSSDATHFFARIPVLSAFKSARATNYTDLPVPTLFWAM